MNLRRWLKYWWAGAFGLMVILLTMAVSAEFSWSTVDDHTGQFLKDWASTWVLSLATLVLAIAALLQVIVLRVGQRVQNAPVLRLDLSLWKGDLEANPREGRYADPFQDEALDGRRQDDPQPTYLILRVENLQPHPAGAANDTSIQVMLLLARDEEYSFDFPLGHLAPAAVEIHALVDLRGLNWSYAQILYIEFTDDTGASCEKAHGLLVLQRLEDGTGEPGYVTIG